MTKQVWIRSVLVLSIMAGVLYSGCQPQQRSVNISSTRGRLGGAIDPAQLRLQLWRVLGRALSELASTASEIASATKERRVRENTLRWKIRVHDAIQGIMMDLDPRMAYLQSWIWAEQERVYLVDGEGAGLFDAQQKLAIAVVKKIEEEIVALGQRSFSESSIDAARDDIAEMAKQEAGMVLNGSVKKKSGLIGSRSGLEQILSIPLLPMGSLQGVADAPEAIQQFTHVARDFGGTVHHLPERARWQLELVMLELESLDSVQTTLVEMAELNDSIRSISQTMEHLPNDVRGEFEKSLAALDKSQPQLQATLQDADKTLTEMTKAAQAAQAAAAEIKAMLNEWKKDEPEEDPKEKASVGDYTVMAERIETAAKELRLLLADLNAPAVEGSQGASATVRLRELVDLLFWRAIFLVLVILICVVVYRLIITRVDRKRS